MSDQYKELPMNFFLSATSGTLAFALDSNFIVAILMPCAFFLIGKTIDVAVRIYLETRRRNNAQ